MENDDYDNDDEEKKNQYTHQNKRNIKDVLEFFVDYVLSLEGKISWRKKVLHSRHDLWRIFYCSSIRPNLIVFIS